MPEKITLEDGSEREILTAEEQTALQTKAQKAEELEGTVKTLNESLGVPEGKNLVDYAKELKESANPNWPKFRAAMDNMKSALKEKGIETNENGEVVAKPLGITQEDAQKIASDQVTKALQENKKGELLGKISDASERQVVQNYLDKLMALGGTLEENYSIAYAKAFPERKIDPLKEVINSSGGAPRINNSGNAVEFATTEEGSALAKSMGLGFAQDKK
jgi:hypothetical protein